MWWNFPVICWCLSVDYWHHWSLELVQGNHYSSPADGTTTKGKHWQPRLWPVNRQITSEFLKYQESERERYIQDKCKCVNTEIRIREFLFYIFLYIYSYALNEMNIGRKVLNGFKALLSKFGKVARTSLCYDWKLGNVNLRQFSSL